MKLCTILLWLDINELLQLNTTLWWQAIPKQSLISELQNPMMQSHMTGQPMWRIESPKTAKATIFFSSSEALFSYSPCHKSLESLVTLRQGVHHLTKSCTLVYKIFANVWKYSNSKSWLLYWNFHYIIVNYCVLLSTFRCTNVKVCLYFLEREGTGWDNSKNYCTTILQGGTSTLALWQWTTDLKLLT